MVVKTSVSGTSYTRRFSSNIGTVKSIIVKVTRRLIKDSFAEPLLLLLKSHRLIQRQQPTARWTNPNTDTWPFNASSGFYARFGEQLNIWLQFTVSVWAIAKQFHANQGPCDIVIPFHWDRKLTQGDILTGSDENEGVMNPCFKFRRHFWTKNILHLLCFCDHHENVNGMANLCKSVLSISYDAITPRISYVRLGRGHTVLNMIPHQTNVILSH